MDNSVTPASAKGHLHILHVDMDAFFAAVELLDNPALRGQPVIIGSPPDQRGVVATCSYEARRYGVHSAMPSRTAGQLCPHGIFLPPRMERYAEMSRRLFTLMEEFTPMLEPVSVDEAFLDVAGVLWHWPDSTALATALKRRIREATGLTASVGVAPNKFLAKLASDLEKPDGLTVAPSEPDAIRRFLAPLPVTKIWGVGKVTADSLHQAGLRTIGQLQECPLDRLARLLGINSATHLHALAFGRDHRQVVPEAAPEKSISNETTFPVDVADSAILRRTLLELAEQVARRLRANGRLAKTLHLKIRFADFTTITRQMPINPPDCADRTLLRLTSDLWARQEIRQPVRLLGVGVTPVPEAATKQTPKPIQPLLFDLESVATPSADSAPKPPRDPATEARLDAAVDALRARFGSTILRRGLDSSPKKESRNQGE